VTLLIEGRTEISEKQTRIAFIARNGIPKIWQPDGLDQAESRSCLAITGLCDQSGQGVVKALLQQLKHPRTVKNGAFLRRRCELTQNDLVSVSHQNFILSSTLTLQSPPQDHNHLRAASFAATTLFPLAGRGCPGRRERRCASCVPRSCPKSGR